MTTAAPIMERKRAERLSAHGLPSGFRLALVGPLPPPSGGMANQTRQLARLWRNGGVEVDLVVTNRAYHPAWVGKLRGVRALFRLLPYAVALWRAAGQCSLIHVMANSGWSWHLFAAPAILIGRLRGVPVAVNYRGGQAGAFLERQGRFVAPVLRLANRLVVPSDFLREVFRRHGLTAEIVPNIIDVERFRPANPQPPRFGGGCILVARNLEAIYDVATALRAFARVAERYPAARLVVAGSGPERDALSDLARFLEIADRVRFTGRVDNDRMAELYRDADVLLNTSRVDNMPNSLLEAMASGVPIVSSEVGGIPYLIQSGDTGLLVPPCDPEAAADAVLRVLSDPVLAERLKRRAGELVQAYAWENVRPQWLSLYGEMVKETGRAVA